MENTNLLTEEEEAEVVGMLEEILKRLEELIASLQKTVSANCVSAHFYVKKWANLGKK